MYYLAVFDFDISSRLGDAGHPPRPGRPRHSMDAARKLSPSLLSRKTL